MPFTDTLHVRWSIIDVKRIWGPNILRKYITINLGMVSRVTEIWVPTFCLMVKTTVGGTPVGPPKPFIYPEIYDSKLSPHYGLGHIGIDTEVWAYGKHSTTTGNHGKPPEFVDLRCIRARFVFAYRLRSTLKVVQSAL